MNNKKTAVVLLAITLLAGCATGINSRQKLELQTYESRGLAIEEKKPGTATALGILPGGGSFYGREYGLGVVNLLLWPLSICWDPVSGYNAATRINYIETKQHVATLKNKETNELNQRMLHGLIDEYSYRVELANISQKYDLEPMAQPMLLAPAPNSRIKTMEQPLKD